MSIDGETQTSQEKDMENVCADCSLEDQIFTELNSVKNRLKTKNLKPSQKAEIYLTSLRLIEKNGYLTRNQYQNFSLVGVTNLRDLSPCGNHSPLPWREETTLETLLEETTNLFKNFTITSDAKALKHLVKLMRQERRGFSGLYLKLQGFKSRLLNLRYMFTPTRQKAIFMDMGFGDDATLLGFKNHLGKDQPSLGLYVMPAILTPFLTGNIRSSVKAPPEASNTALMEITGGLINTLEKQNLKTALQTAAALL